MPDDFEWEKLLALARDHAVAYRRSLPARRVAAPLTVAEVRRELAEIGPLPLDGRAAEEVLNELVGIAGPGLTAMSGPRFFGWVTGGTLPAALAVDWMTSAWDQNAGPAAGSPAATAFEMAALGWVTEVLGLPQETCGALVTGAMAANFVALAAARTRVL